MKRWILVSAALSALQLPAQVRPHRVNATDLNDAPYNSAGLLFTEVAGSEYRGSAVVARDTRLLYTCAHVLYDSGVWATGAKFARAWHASTDPDSTDMIGVRGYRYYAPYSGTNRAADFALDFAVCYRTGTTYFGPALPTLTRGVEALRNSTTAKLILGYPARRDYDRVSGRYFQHETGPFPKPMRQIKGAYHTLSGVSTGPGNSGGPLVVQIDGVYTLAGMLVSGSSNSIGVHGLNKAAAQMAINALADLDHPKSDDLLTKTVSNTSDLRLPDGTQRYSRRSLKVFGAGASSTSVRFSLRIETPFRGDMDVYLRSPTGRVRWVHKHSLSENSVNLVLSKADYTSSFLGTDVNGTWRIFMRDYYRGDRATYQKAILSLTGM